MLVLATSFLVVQDLLHTTIDVQGEVTVLIAALGVLHILASANGPSWALKSSYMPVAMWLFVIWALFRMVLDPHGLEGLQNWLLWFIFPAVTAIIAGRSTAGTVERIYPHWKRLSVLAALIYIGTVLIAGPGAQIFYSARGAGWMGLLGLALIIPWTAIKGGSWWPTAIIMTAIVLSESRTPLAIAAISLVIVFALRQHRGRRPTRGRIVLRGLTIGAVVGAVTLWAVANLQFLTERFTGGDGYTIAGVELNTSGRAILWSLTTDFWQERPWLGHGPGASQDLMDLYFPGFISHPHSEYLRILADTGIVGMALWGLGMLGLLVGGFRRLKRSTTPVDRAIHVAAILGTVIMLLGAVTGNITISIYSVMLIGALLGLSASRARLIGATEPQPVKPVRRKPTTPAEWRAFQRERSRSRR